MNEGDQRPRTVDAAIQAQRPAKQTIRSLWIQKVLEYHKLVEPGEPLYLCLPGKEAQDLKLLEHHNILTYAENKSVSAESAALITAIENSTRVYAKLKNSYPGLRLYNTTIGGLLGGDKLTNFPTRKEVKKCRARVVNLDLDEPLREVEDDTGHKYFPVINHIIKFSELHLEQNNKWCLLLTLHGEIVPHKITVSWLAEILKKNCEKFTSFSDHCRGIFGSDSFRRLMNDPSDEELVQEIDHQGFLLIAVPKLIFSKLSSKGWRATVSYSLRYGGAGAAPMVTWALEFAPDQGVSAPVDLYENNIDKIGQNSGYVDDSGQIEWHQE